MSALQSLVRHYRRGGGGAALRAIERRTGLVPASALLDKPWMDGSWLLPGIPNQRNLRVFAMRRSGHHAIINWIRYQLPGRHCFLNECRIGENPFESCHRGNSVVRGWVGEHRYVNWRLETAGRHAKKGSLIHNYEDGNFRRHAEEVDQDIESGWIGDSEESLSVLILRDPFNLFASRLRWLESRGERPSEAEFVGLMQLWRAYALEFLGRAESLSPKICVSYNRWFSSREYRDAVAGEIGFENQDVGVREVAKWGPSTWGASFDGMKYDGKAQQMKVLQRWEAYRDDEFFRALFDRETVQLSEAVFGEIPGTTVLTGGSARA